MVGMLGMTVASSPLWVLGRLLLHRCCRGRACCSCCAATTSQPPVNGKTPDCPQPDGSGPCSGACSVCASCCGALSPWVGGGSGLVHRLLGVWCVRCVVHLLVLLWVSHFRCGFEGRVATPVRWLVTGGMRIRLWPCSIPREPSGRVAHCRFCVCASVHRCVGAEDLQRCGVLFAESCPGPWPVLWHHVLPMSVYDCPIRHLRFVPRLR